MLSFCFIILAAVCGIYVNVEMSVSDLAKKRLKVACHRGSWIWFQQSSLTSIM